MEGPNAHFFLFSHWLRPVSPLSTLQENHTGRRGALCVELTANIRQYIAETDAQLRGMFEAHYDDVTAAATVGACMDTTGMDVLYAEACCGHDG